MKAETLSFSCPVFSVTTHLLSAKALLLSFCCISWLMRILWCRQGPSFCKKTALQFERVNLSCPLCQDWKFLCWKFLSGGTCRIVSTVMYRNNILFSKSNYQLWIRALENYRTWQKYPSLNICTCKRKCLRNPRNQRETYVILIFQEGKKYPGNCRLVALNLTSWGGSGKNHPGYHCQTHES